MIIAKEKRKSNIAEYILYMWQVEDLIRAYNFDAARIGQEYVSRFDADEVLKSEITGWYSNLLLMMQREHIQQRGHLQFLKNLVNDLTEFHLRLLQDGEDGQYLFLWQQAQGQVADFRQRMQQDDLPDVEVCLNGLYGLMLLRLQQKEVSVETQRSVLAFGKLIAHLSARYIQFEKGDFEF